MKILQGSTTIMKIEYRLYIIYTVYFPTWFLTGRHVKMFRNETQIDTDIKLYDMDAHNTYAYWIKNMN